VTGKGYERGRVEGKEGKQQQQLVVVVVVVVFVVVDASITQNIAKICRAPYQTNHNKLQSNSLHPVIPSDLPPWYSLSLQDLTAITDPTKGGDSWAVWGSKTVLKAN
jgi:hypothetical protein